MYTFEYCWLYGDGEALNEYTGWTASNQRWDTIVNAVNAMSAWAIICGQNGWPCAVRVVTVDPNADARANAQTNTTR